MTQQPCGTNFKVKTIKRNKGRKTRAAAKVVTSVRAACVLRDGYCRAWRDGILGCAGPSQWAHLPGHTRAQTRGQKPERRHTTDGSVMLCMKHHNQLDGRWQPRLLVRGTADSNLDWRELADMEA